MNQTRQAQWEEFEVTKIDAQQTAVRYHEAPFREHAQDASHDEHKTTTH
jgi:hypothetical protein